MDVMVSTFDDGWAIAPGDLLAFDNAQELSLHEMFDVDEWIMSSKNTKAGKKTIGIVASALRATPDSQVSVMYIFTPQTMGWQWKGNPFRIIRKWFE